MEKENLSVETQFDNLINQLEKTRQKEQLSKTDYEDITGRIEKYEFLRESYTRTKGAINYWEENVEDVGYDLAKELKVEEEQYESDLVMEMEDILRKENPGLEELKNAINEFHVEEFDISDEESIKELNQNDVVPLVHSSLGDSDELHVQTFLNVSEKRLEKVVSGDHLEEVEYLNYDSIEEIIEDLEDNEFDYFIELDEIDKDELIEKDQLAESQSLEKPFYLVPSTLQPNMQETPLYSLNDLKEEIINDLSIERKLETVEPDDDTKHIDNIYNAEKIAVASANVDELNEYMKKQNLSLAHVPAKEITENDFATDNMEVFIDNDSFLENFKERTPSNNHEVDKTEQFNKIGTVIYEPANKEQQALVVENLKTGKNQEYAINNMNIQSNGRQIPLSQMLDSKNLTEMNHSIKNNEPTSFMLNKNEMQKVEQQGLTKGLETNIPDNKQEALLELKEQYTSFQHALKEESKGELTEEKVINRMEIENQYNSSKTEVIETYPESKETIQMMEKNVRTQQVKSNQNNLSM